MKWVNKKSFVNKEFYPIKIDLEAGLIRGFYIKDRDKRVLRIKDMQYLLWFVLYVVLVANFRPHVLLVLIGTLCGIGCFNYLIRHRICRHYQEETIKADDGTLYYLYSKKYQYSLRIFAFLITGVSFTRFILNYHQSLYSDSKVMYIYAVAFVISVLSLIRCIRYGKIKTNYKSKMR